MLRRVVALVLTATFVAVPRPAEAVDPPEPRATDVPLTAFAYGGYSHRALRRDAHGISTLAVDGVALSASGDAVREPDDAAVGLAAEAADLGLATELLVHNYSNDLGDFDRARLHRLLSDPDAIAAVVADLAAYVDAGGWDGVNVDFELVAAGDAAGLVALCEQLQAAMPEEKVVTIDISASRSLRSYRERGYDLAGIADAVDRVELMAYDQHGPGWSGPGPVGGLRWQRQAVRTMLKVVPADQVDLGTAGYGYTWAPRSRRGGWTVSPGLARAKARQAGVRPVWHPRAGEWSARLPGGRVMWWADQRSFRQRVKLARQVGVHGMALWRLGAADPLP